MTTTTPERPILFSAPMVQAILAGRKSMTRRVVKLPRYPAKPDLGAAWVDDGGAGNVFAGAGEQYLKVPYDDGTVQRVFCPHGSPGDRLWVKESFCHAIGDADGKLSHDAFRYEADGGDVRAVDGDGFQRYRKDGSEASPWVSPLFMPRRASRIFLEISDVRVERLTEITEADAKAEGVDPIPFKTEHPPEQHAGYREAFALLWDSINGKKYPWASNPFVWIIAFRRVEGGAQ